MNYPYLILITFLYILICLIVAYIAKEKGRCWILYFLITFFLTPTTGYLTILALPDLDEKKKEEQRHKELMEMLKNTTK